MKLSPEQRETRAAVINAVGRLVREWWAHEQAGPVPEHITRLVARLGGDDVIESASGEARDDDAPPLPKA